LALYIAYIGITNESSIVQTGYLGSCFALAAHFFHEKRTEMWNEGRGSEQRANDALQKKCAMNFG